MYHDRKLKMAYRPSGWQIPLITVIQELRLWDEYGLEVELELVESSGEAERLLIEKTIDLLVGNHLHPLADRVKGIPIIYLAQANNWCGNLLATREDISSLPDLKGKRVAVGTSLDTHPVFTIRLLLDEAGLEPEKDKIRFVAISRNVMEQMDAVLRGEADATFVNPPYELKAKKLGLKVVEIPRLPMVCGITVTTLSPFAAAHGELIKQVLKVLIHGIWYFKTHKRETIKILGDRLSQKMELESEELLDRLYTSQADNLEEKLYPTLEAIKNVYRTALFAYPEVEGLNPLVMWDLHYMRELDEEGFVDKLYKG